MAGMPESAKGIINWVLVVGIIAFILLLFGIIFGNLSNNVGFEQETFVASNEIYNFTGTITVNESVGKIHPSISGITAVNQSAFTVPATNYSTSLGTIIVDANSAYDSESINISYTLSYDSQGLIDTQAIILNYTESGTNTAAQLPTVGTIIGIVLLIIILLSVLVFVILRLMGITEKTGGNRNAQFGNSNGKF